MEFNIKSNLNVSAMDRIILECHDRFGKAYQRDEDMAKEHRTPKIFNFECLSNLYFYVLEQYKEYILHKRIYQKSIFEKNIFSDYYSRLPDDIKKILIEDG